MNVTLQVVIALHRFRNIDILSQGLFRIVVSVTSGATSDSGDHFRLVTLGHSRRSASDGRYNTSEQHQFHNSEITGNGAWGVSRSFFVRYVDQVEPLTEIMTFQHDVPITDAFSSRDFLVVHFDLYHLQKELCVEGKAHDNLSEFAFVQRRSAPVPNPTLCVNTYLPLVFQKWYFATITSTLHCSIVGFTSDGDGIITEGGYGALASHAVHSAQALSRFINDCGMNYDEIDDEDAKTRPTPRRKESTLLLCAGERSIDHPLRWYAMERPTSTPSDDEQSSNLPPLSRLLTNLLRLWDYAIHIVMTMSYKAAVVSLRKSFYHHIRLCATQGTATNLLLYPSTTPPIHLVIQSETPLTLHPDHRKNSKHGIVLVHGYGGGDCDFRVFKRYIQLFCPHAIVYASRYGTMSSSSHAPLPQLATALSDDVRSFIKEEGITRLSFVGHSMGGVVIRLALLEASMVPLYPLLHSIMTLNCPHLGTTHAASQTLPRLARLCLPRNSCLHSLHLCDDVLREMAARDVMMTHFRNVVLVNAVGDTLVDAGSALIQPNSFPTSPTTSVVRCSVPSEHCGGEYDNGVTLFTTMDRVLSKQAHLAPLCNMDVVIHLVLCFQEVFL